VSVFRGHGDPLTPAAEVARWAGHASADAVFHTLPGGHFFVFDRAAQVCARIARDCLAAQLSSAK
jgi:surfactin synthase thioesterase subunit